jgi:hypothetical protein
MMKLIRLIGGRTASAPVARERLQILLAHERGLRGRPDLLGVLSQPVSRDRTRSLLDNRRQRQRHPLARIQLRKSRSATKALEIARSRIGVARLLTNATWPAVVAWSSSDDCRPVRSRRTADVR